MNKDVQGKKGLWSWIKRRKWWLILFVIVGAIFVYFINSGSNSQATGLATATISRGDLRQVVTATGEIQPLNTINVGSQVSGTIEEIFVDYNSKVKKGDVLLKIEPSVLQASVDEAKASLVSSESQRDYAKSEYERNKILYEDGFIARAELEQSQTTYEQAEQNVNKMKSQYDRAVTNLGYATITSPVDGTVMAKYVEKGELAVQGRTLFKVANINDMYLKAYITSGQITGLKIGQEVKVFADSGDSDRKEYRGVISWISDKAEFTPKTIQTRDERANLVYAVKIKVQNDGYIKRGMYGEVSF